MSNVQASLVPTEFVNNVWEDIIPYVEKAAEYSYGRYLVEDILDCLIQYNHHLWIVFDETKIHAMVVTAFKDYPRKRFLDLVFVGGETGSLAWKEPILTLLQHWAFDNDCDGIESSGRLGWGKAFKKDGYKPLWQTYELPVADCGLGE